MYDVGIGGFRRNAVRVSVARAIQPAWRAFTMPNDLCATVCGGDVAEKRSDITRPVLLQVLGNNQSRGKWDPSAEAVELHCLCGGSFQH